MESHLQLFSLIKVCGVIIWRRSEVPERLRDTAVLKILLRVVLVSNLRKETGYPESFTWIPQSLQENARIVP
jgi:hypothetical protein